MVAFKKKSSGDRVITLQRVMKRLESEQDDEDTPPVHMTDILRGMRYLVDHLVALEDEFEPLKEGTDNV